MHTVWYFHYAQPDWHERNLYLWKEVAKSWEGHNFELINLYERGAARRLERSGNSADIAYITNFQCSDVLERSVLDITKKAKFRLFITGGGWRRPDWVKRSLEGVKAIKADLVCLTHLPHEDKFKKIHSRVHHVGLGFDPKVFYPAPNEERFLSMVFCGNPAMGRRKNLERLIDTWGLRIIDFRQGLTHAQMSAYLRHARIGWNQIGRMDGVSCNLRVWEILGCGTLLFCNQSKHVPLKDGVHYIAWKDPDDMMKKAKYWLAPANEEERAAIALNGLNEALKKHTWAHRAQEYKSLILDSV